MWERSDRSERGDGDRTRRALLLRLGLGDGLCLRFLIRTTRRFKLDHFSGSDADSQHGGVWDSLLFPVG